MGFLVFIMGLVSGVILNLFTMKINFKQRTIDNKIKTFDALIVTWVKMRNSIFEINRQELGAQQNWTILDKIYSETQVYVGEVFLICEDHVLAIDINTWNEKFYRQGWDRLKHSDINRTLESLKEEALRIISRMRKNIEDSSVMKWTDICHIFSKKI